MKETYCNIFYLNDEQSNPLQALDREATQSIHQSVIYFETRRHFIENALPVSRVQISNTNIITIIQYFPVLKGFFFSQLNWRFN